MLLVRVLKKYHRLDALTDELNCFWESDISILPKLNNGHTQAPAYMIGEKAALLVLEDNKP